MQYLTITHFYVIFYLDSTGSRNTTLGIEKPEVQLKVFWLRCPEMHLFNILAFMKQLVETLCKVSISSFMSRHAKEGTQYIKTQICAVHKANRDARADNKERPIAYMPQQQSSGSSLRCHL